MKANELRIGNYISFNNEERTVLGIRNASSHLYEPVYLVDLNYQYQKKVLVNLKDISCISLTEDWLLRLGFQYYKPLNYWRMVINDVIYSVDKNFRFTFVNLNFDELQYMPSLKIESVSQLQNLFYSLTGILLGSEKELNY